MVIFDHEGVMKGQQVLENGYEGGWNRLFSRPNGGSTNLVQLGIGILGGTLDFVITY
jgi:hypothetical protein